ncbi:hypothetical protein [Paraburkholderia atlantica]|uniref:hypothetical protein n=1 Tax=Paraburkholderia atlantica TaxID=2654982 RepID=UPI001621D0BA|nr:hypothetical protein [Paraburkholderia atlantica]MBB5509608.1 hypothetical protein [Paraburkholderia atlantica]
MKALDSTPRSTAEISKLIGMTQRATCEVLHRASAENLCHVYDSRKGVGLRWVAGTADSNDYAIEKAEREAKKAAHAAKPFKAFRDPFVALLFGEPA